MSRSSGKQNGNYRVGSRFISVGVDFNTVLTSDYIGVLVKNGNPTP